MESEKFTGRGWKYGGTLEGLPRQALRFLTLLYPTPLHN